jgi:hypothetical protein
MAAAGQRFELMDLLMSSSLLLRFDWRDCEIVFVKDAF